MDRAPHSHEAARGGSRIPGNDLRSVITTRKIQGGTHAGDNHHDSYQAFLHHLTAIRKKVLRTAVEKKTARHRPIQSRGWFSPAITPTHSHKIMGSRLYSFGTAPPLPKSPHRGHKRNRLNYRRMLYSGIFFIFSNSVSAIGLSEYFPLSDSTQLVYGFRFVPRGQGREIYETITVKFHGVECTPDYCSYVKKVERVGIEKTSSGSTSRGPFVEDIFDRLLFDFGPEVEVKTFEYNGETVSALSNSTNMHDHKLFLPNEFKYDFSGGCFGRLPMPRVME